jgi:hypothetical protein
MRPRILQVAVLRKEGVHAGALRAAEGGGDELAPSELASQLVRLEQVGQRLLQHGLVQPVVGHQLGNRDCFGDGWVGGVRTSYMR